MTLVVSDISKHGIIMVGDSAVTQTEDNSSPRIIAGALKVQYSVRANIGITMWGNADVGNERMDSWISKFIESSIKENDSVEDVGNRLVEHINPILESSRKPWKDLVRGFHIGGFIKDTPILYHVHCGHSHEPPHEMRLYKDFPDSKKWDEETYKKMLASKFLHLRNGYYPLLGRIFEHILEYSKSIKKSFNISFPQDELKSRFEFYKFLVKFVAEVLAISGERQGVNSELSAIAFTKSGIQIKEQIEMEKNTKIDTPNMSVII